MNWAAVRWPWSTPAPPDGPRREGEKYNERISHMRDRSDGSIVVAHRSPRGGDLAVHIPPTYANAFLAGIAFGLVAGIAYSAAKNRH